jgi:hypothetical protein
MNMSIQSGAESGVVMGAVMGAVALGQYLVWRAFFRETAFPALSFPIILRPYRWMVIGSHGFCGLVIIGFLGFLVFFPGTGAKCLGATGLLVFSLVWYSVFRGSRQYIRIDQDGFSYVKSKNKSIDVKGRDVVLFFAPPVGGNILISIKGKNRRVVIPMMFQRINLLRYCLAQWCGGKSLA